MVRDHFFVTTIGANRLHARLEGYPLGPGIYVARVEVSPGNRAIEAVRLTARVEYTGDTGLKAEEISEDEAKRLVG